MSRFCFCLAVLALLSCHRGGERDYAAVDFADGLAAIELQPSPTEVPPAGGLPMEVPPQAVLQAGEFPLWFQFTEYGPTLIETIEDARYSAALIPWPHAPHARFVLAYGDDLLLAVNRYGFIRLSPWPGTGGIGLHRVAGGEFWRQYTVGAFVRPGPNAYPVALLYRNEWFLYQDVPLPSPRLWTFGRYSTAPSAASLPSLDAFAPEDGWGLDVLRRGGSGYWYFRASRGASAGDADRQEIRMLRTQSLAMEGERISLGQFHNAARPEPISAASPLLLEMLAAVFSASGSGSAYVVSPEFQDIRRFATNAGGGMLRAFFSPGSGLVATHPEGGALYMEAGNFAPRRFSLPTLPDGFVYTGIGMVGDTVFATWEEQVGYSIGAAGFMAIRPAGI
ncbi:MAG: hypothetical protein FWD88_08235 [Treponema sp.]|nr:hypothetical protein [Treponema sp.]